MTGWTAEGVWCLAALGGEQAVRVRCAGGLWVGKGGRGTGGRRRGVCVRRHGQRRRRRMMAMPNQLVVETCAARPPALRLCRRSVLLFEWTF